MYALITRRNNNKIIFCRTVDNVNDDNNDNDNELLPMAIDKYIHIYLYLYIYVNIRLIRVMKESLKLISS